MVIASDLIVSRRSRVRICLGVLFILTETFFENQFFYLKLGIFSSYLPCYLHNQVFFCWFENFFERSSKPLQLKTKTGKLIIQLNNPNCLQWFCTIETQGFRRRCFYPCVNYHYTIGWILYQKNALVVFNARLKLIF